MPAQGYTPPGYAPEPTPGVDVRPETAMKPSVIAERLMGLNNEISANREIALTLIKQLRPVLQAMPKPEKEEEATARPPRRGPELANEIEAMGEHVAETSVILQRALDALAL